jgi:hypothetical protein
MVVSGRRDADAFGLSDAFKSRCNVYTVAKNIMRLDDYVADIDTHAESDARVFRLADCKLLDTGLELRSSSNRFDRARKFRQEPVAGILHDAAAVFGDCGMDNLGQKRG